MENTPKINKKNNVLASGTCLDRSGIVDLPGGKNNFSKSSTEWPIQAIFDFSTFFLKNRWRFLAILLSTTHLLCVSLPAGAFFLQKKSLLANKCHISLQKTKMAWMGHSVELLKYFSSPANRLFQIDLDGSRSSKHFCLIDVEGILFSKKSSFFF